VKLTEVGRLFHDSIGLANLDHSPDTEFFYGIYAIEGQVPL